MTPDQPDLMSRLAEIDQKAGRDRSWDPSKIEGEPGPNLPPPIRERDPGPVPEPDWANPEVDIEVVPDEEAPPWMDDSPLLPRQTAQVPPGPSFVPPPVPEPDMAVVSSGGKCVAVLAGRQVDFLMREEAQVKAVIIKALRRNLREQEVQLMALLPKRKRRGIGSGLGPSKAAGSSIGNDEVGLSGNQPAPGGNPGAHGPVPPAAKKRRGGRPKKVRQQLDGTERPQ